MKIFLGLFSFLLFFNSLFSETVILKDGTTIKIKLIGQNADIITYTTKGKEATLAKSKIRKIIYAKTAELEEKQVQEELKKLKQEKAAKVAKKSKEQEEEEARLLDEEIHKALEEQKRQELLNLSFEERIKKLEDDLARIKSQGGSGGNIAIYESDLNDLKIRTKRVEKFLEIDPDIDDYYNKPRTPWSVIWRSTLIPGWGLSYARDSFGSIYTTLFFISGMGAYVYKDNLSSVEKELNNKLINDLIVQPYAYNLFVSTSSAATSATSTADFNSIQTYNKTIKSIKFLQSRDNYQDGLDRSDKMVTAALGIYVIQLIHSSIVGYFWSKRLPGKFNETDLDKKGSWNFQISPFGRRNVMSGASSLEFSFGYSYNF